MTTILVPCPLCGTNKGYSLKSGSTHRWWIPVCLGCAEPVSECRSDPDLPHNALVPDRWGLADDAWNSAGAHAQGLRDENARLRSALELARRLCDEALPKFNWGASSLDANAIGLLNSVPGAINAALAKEPK